MDITFSCDKCGQHIVIEEEEAGGQVKCPTCQAELLVPLAQPAQSSPTPPANTPSVISKSTTPLPERGTDTVIVSLFKWIFVWVRCVCRIVMPLSLREAYRAGRYEFPQEATDRYIPPIVSNSQWFTELIGFARKHKIITSVILGLVACLILGFIFPNDSGHNKSTSAGVAKYEEECMKNCYDPITVRYIAGLQGNSPLQATARYKQERANSFIRISEEELIRRLGQPKEVRVDKTGEGEPYKMLIYDEETLFIIFNNEGTVYSGRYSDRWFSR